MIRLSVDEFNEWVKLIKMGISVGLTKEEIRGYLTGEKEIIIPDEWREKYASRREDTTVGTSTTSL